MYDTEKWPLLNGDYDRITIDMFSLPVGVLKAENNTLYSKWPIIRIDIKQASIWKQN